MGKQAKATSRPVVAGAFGRYLRDLRTRHGWSLESVVQLLGTRARASDTFLSHVEQGKTAAPDPVLLREIALLYGVNYSDLVELLRRNRLHPDASIEQLRQQPQEADMVIRGDDVYWYKRYRALSETQRAQLKEYMDFLDGKRGAAIAEAPFRHGHAHKKR